MFSDIQPPFDPDYIMTHTVVALIKEIAQLEIIVNSPVNDPGSSKVFII